MAAASNLPADQRRRFGSLLPREVLVLVAWLKLHEAEYDSWQFDVRIGKGYDPGDAYTEDMRSMSILNSQKRMDALGWQGSQATIVEVKERAGLGAVGQLVGYKALFQQEHQDLPAPLLVLVAMRADGDLLPALVAVGIRLELVAPE
jgi:hypothetical protein